MAHRFNIDIVVKDIEAYLKKKKIIPRTAHIVIGPSDYDWEIEEMDGHPDLRVGGSFTVYLNPNDVLNSGIFKALVPGVEKYNGLFDEYSLVLNWKGEEIWVWD